ncbi:NAD(P)-dependent alcohol dehydrogenase [archaeon 13_1_40CM_2_52_13]|nr:MAG: NAD(P)-dependent alcohol dehydrogenase [archaeon 13_1_40CM_2_52_13]TMI39120.1 MAG: NAD(P)-dependent alcohol dehydrogenase [Candidatus Bathyarchaeota archaeon]
MKAIVCTRYGPPEVLQLRDVEKPIPKDNEVLIRVHAATVTKGDCELRSLELPLLWKLFLRIGFGIRAPRKKILGQELAGEIESVGSAVTLFKKGDQVFANTGLRLGAYAEYDCLPEKGLVAIKPANMSYEEAAAVPVGGLHALQYLRKANVQTGHKVLINGAGGSIGTVAVQLAKYYGAEVTGVDSIEKLDTLSSIGADHAIDYTREDFTENGEKYDVIFDTVGKSPYSRSIRSLKEKGIYLLGNPGLSQMIRAPWTSRRSSKKVIGRMEPYRTEDLTFLKELIEAGEIRSVIDRRYPLEETIEAHRYVDTGQKRGNVVITVGT